MHWGLNSRKQLTARGCLHKSKSSCCLVLCNTDSSIWLPSKAKTRLSLLSLIFFMYYDCKLVLIEELQFNTHKHFSSGDKCDKSLIHIYIYLKLFYFF